MSQPNTPVIYEETVNTPPPEIIPSFLTEEPVEEPEHNPFLLTEEEEWLLLQDEEALRAFEEEQAREETTRREPEAKEEADRTERWLDIAYKEWKEDVGEFSAYDNSYYTD